MEDLRFGKSVDTRAARDAVEELVMRVSADASAGIDIAPIVTAELDPVPGH